MSRCWALAVRYGKFVIQPVIELLRACPLVVLYNMSVAGVRVVEFDTNEAGGQYNVTSWTKAPAGTIPGEGSTQAKQCRTTA